MTFSTFRCTDCVFMNNSAGFSGGAVFVEQESSAIVKNCVFRKNFAVSGGSVFFFSSSTSTLSVIESSLMEANDGGTSGVIFSQVSAFVLNNVTVRNNLGDESAGIIMLLSTISISNSLFSNMSGNTAAFLGLYTRCSATIINSTFERGSCNLGGGIFLSSTSQVTVRSSSFTDFTALQGGVVSANSNSTVTLSEVSMTKSRSSTPGSLLEMTESSLSISASTFSHYSASGISAKQLGRVFVQTSSFEGGSGQMGAAAYFRQCESVTIVNCVFKRHHSDIGGVLAFEALERKALQRVQIIDSTFSDNYAKIAGAIYVMNQKVSIVGVEFTSNSASEGGALLLACTFVDMCEFNIGGSTFTNNTAALQGGGISWKSVKPNLADVTFANNSAKYGADVASFAVSFQVDSLVPKRISPPSRHLSNTVTAAPGQMVDTALVATLRDHYGQVIVIDNSSVGVIEAVTSGTAVTGLTKVFAVEGVVVFDSFIVIAEANSTAEIKVSSSAVAESVEGDPDPHFPFMLLNVTVRSCLPGEYESPGMCTVCGPGTFSFKPSVPCQTCKAHSVCLGNMTVYPESGYWRSSQYSSIIRECPNPSSCLGGQVESRQLSLTGYCSEGYEGNLCQSCEDGFSPSGKNQCGKCPPRRTNIARISFVCLAMLIVIVVTVWSTMRAATRPTATHSIMIRIFVNYLQLVLLVTEFRLSWPRPLLELFSAQESVGGVTEQAYSFDCFLGDGRSDSATFYKKSVLMVLLPLPLILGSIVVWGAVAIKQRSKVALKRECAATVIILFFMFLPNLVKSLFSLFSCTEIESGEFWLTVDMATRCWDGTHDFYTRAVGLPGILVWILGVPLCCLGVLRKHRRQLDELWLKLQYGFLINGYRRRCYYWEFVILYRKVLVIVCSVFLISSTAVQALTVQFILLFAFFLHYVTSPYRIDSLNSTEAWSIVVADVTIYCGLYYLTVEISEATSWVLFLIIVSVNIVFIAYWLYGLLGHVIGMVSESVPALGRLLRPGQFHDKYMDDFMEGLSVKWPQAERLLENGITGCYRQILAQEVPLFDRLKYTPRPIPSIQVTEERGYLSLNRF